MGEIKKLQFVNGTDVTEPSDLSLSTTQNNLGTYADDTAFTTANGAATNGDIYANSTINAVKFYISAAWRALVDTTTSQTLLNKLISSTGAITGALTMPSGTTAERPTPVNGMVRYNTENGAFEGYANSVWSGIGGGGTTDLVTQNAHGFVVGDVLYLNSSTYTKAIATSSNAAEVVGIVSRVVSANQFELTMSGEVSGLSGLTAGTVYYLSATTAGAMSSTAPTTIGYIDLPIGVATSATSMYVVLKRGAVVGGANARTSIALANNATTTIQDVSAYQAGELTGWVSIAATTPLKFYLEARFSKNGANTNYVIAYTTTGDTPPVGFNVTVTAGGLLQIVMPNVTGFTAASVNFALNAPAVGTTFPLSINDTAVLPSTVSEVSLYSGNGHGSTNNKIRRFTTTWTNTGTGVTYADSATNGASFTINETGIYTVAYSDTRVAGIGAVGLSLNGSALTTSINSLAGTECLIYGLTGAANEAGSVSVTRKFTAGDIIRPHTDGLPDSTGNTKTRFYIVKVARA